MANTMTPQVQSQTMGSSLDDIPIIDSTDLDFGLPKPAFIQSFESACRNGPQSTVQSTVSSEIRTPRFLNNGLVIALRAGNVECVSYLLSVGAPISRTTPAHILSAPAHQQLALFELLAHHGWTPNTPGFYGDVLLPRVVTNHQLLVWFLDHGANPNLGAQRDNRDRMGGSDTNSCAALERAVSCGDLEAVRLLLDAGAVIRNGVLHRAAGACPSGTNPYSKRVTPSMEFDVGRIPIMELLLERGGIDVNEKEASRYMVPGYAIVYAVMAGAVQRVKWLLTRGANPELEGAGGSAVDYAGKMGSEEMKKVVDEGVRERRLIAIEKTDEIGDIHLD